MSRPRAPLPAVLPVLLALLAAAGGIEILSKSRVERCALDDSGAGGRLSCDRKIVLNLAVPSGSSGGESSMVVKVQAAEENGTQAMRAIRDPPVITINKSAVYALYALTYVGTDVNYKPEEQSVETRKCEPDAGADVVKSCEGLWDANGHIIKHTEPVCCPCGPQRRVPSSCGNVFDKVVKGKANTAHCLRFSSDWYHVWEIGQRSLGFSIRVQVKKGSSISEVVVGPENRTVVSGDNSLRVNLVGDLVSYTSYPSFEGFYLVTPRKGDVSGPPQALGDEYSKWMLLERVRFTLDSRECDKIGVGYEAFQSQPNFCSSPAWSCLYNQLWNFWEDDKNRKNRSQPPQYVVEGRFQRINQHPSAGAHTFSVGVTEDLNSDLLLELSADDIEYVYQRSPGKIINIDVPKFEALRQVGIANVTTKNIGKLEASYTLTFKCLRGISIMEEQYFIMKPAEVAIRSFYIRPSSDQATTYLCTAILKASDSSEVARSECQFSTTATEFDNGTQTGSSNDQKKDGFFEDIKAYWRSFWDFVTNFFTGKLCRTKCSSLFDLRCQIQYICMSWIVMVFLLLVTIAAVAVVLWLLHQKGLFDPLYDWWEDLFGLEPDDRGHPRHKNGHHHRHSHRHGDHPYRHHAHPMRNSGPSHHHHVLHRHGEQQADTAEEGHRHWHRHRHDAALGVQQREVGHKHRHGKAVAALHLDEPSRQVPSWLREEDAVVYWDRMRHERHGGHGQHDHELHYCRWCKNGSDVCNVMLIDG